MRSRWLLVGCSLVALAIVFMLNYNFLLTTFLFHGAPLFDVGLLGGLVYRPSVWLYLPTAVAGDQLQSFHATHFSPVLYLLGVPSKFIPIDFITHTALVFAIAFTSISIPISMSLWEFHRRGDLRCGLTALLALAVIAPLTFALSGPVLLAIFYPHFELLFTLFAGLFFLFAARRRFVAASFAFAFCALTREDFSFHLFGFLFVWVGYQMLVMKKAAGELRPWLAYLTAAAIVSPTILVIQHLAFPGDNALVRVYLGSPAYSHVTLQFVLDRLGAIAASREDLIVCLLTTIALSIVLRDPRYLLGYLACVPWFVFSVLAKTDAAGMLWTYYGFPFVLAAIWPILVLVFSTDPAGRDSFARSRAGLVVVVTLAGFTVSTVVCALFKPGFAAMFADMRPAAADGQTAEFALQRMILGGLLDRERIGVDMRVASLSPQAVRRNQIVDEHNQSEFQAIAFYLEDKDLLADVPGTRFLRVGASTVYLAVRPSADSDQRITRLLSLDDAAQLSEQSSPAGPERPREPWESPAGAWAAASVWMGLLLQLRLRRREPQQSGDSVMERVDQPSPARVEPGVTAQLTLFAGKVLIVAAVFVASILVIAVQVENSLKTIGGSEFWSKVEQSIDRAADPQRGLSPEKKQEILNKLRAISTQWRPFVTEAYSALTEPPKDPTAAK